MRHRSSIATLAKLANPVAAAVITIGTLTTTACLDGGISTPRQPPGSGSGSSADGPCTKLTSDLVVRSAADMTGLPKTGCYDLYGKLTLQGAGVTSLAGLNGINSVDDLVLDHTSLAAIDTKQAIGLYGGLTVTGNAKLTNLAQLAFETAATGIAIDSNPQLVSLDPFSADDVPLQEVDGDLSITDNAALAAIAPKHLAKVTGAVTISGNTAAALVDLSQLTTVGPIAIADNPALTQLTGLAATEINGDLAISGNAQLASLGTMTSLYRVTGNLTIDDNTALANLAAFTTSIKFVDQSLTINNNQALTDLGSLKHLQLVGAITITNNKNLASCRASEIDQCVAHPVASVISNNKSSNCSAQCN